MSDPTELPRRHAQVVGIGMVGGSVAAALRNAGWHVTGSDVDAERAQQAVERGLLDAAGQDDTAEITFIATPVSYIAAAAQEALLTGSIVTDVGSVKGGVVSAVAHERFVGGHPMAGSERAGLDGVNPDLFQGATWVLTPNAHTAPDTYLAVRNVVTMLGADVVTLEAQQHDEMVATISHVPHLAASALMSVAVDHAEDHEAVLRLAAGGFRDMTRIAAGHPKLWADITLQNRDAIIDGLGELSGNLAVLQELLTAGNREELEEWLRVAADARKDLPLRQGRPSHLTSLAVVIPDRPGALGQVFAVFGEIGINIEDVEINHAVQGGQGTLLLTVATAGAERAQEALRADGFTVTAEAW